MSSIGVPRAGWWVVFITGAVWVAGCNQKGDRNTAELAGKVTIGGQPLPADAEGSIQFIPQGAGQAAFTRIEESGYRATDVPIGSVTVIFNIKRLTGRMVREDNAPGATPYPEREDLVPAPHRRGLTIEVKGDDDSVNFQL